MARALVIGHGANDPERDETWVPDDKSAGFYAEHDKALASELVAGIINLGDVRPAQIYGGGRPLPNYLFTPDEDTASLTAELAALSSRSNFVLYYVGSGVLGGTPHLLCSNPERCLAAFPKHRTDCAGVLNVIPETDIYFATCRGLLGRQPVVSRPPDGLEAFDDEVGRLADVLHTEAEHDPGTALARWLSMPEATRAMLAARSPGLVEWVEKSAGAMPSVAVIEARAFLAGHGDIALAAWLDQPDLDPKHRQAVLADAEMHGRYRLGAARLVFRTGGHAAFWVHYLALGPEWQDLLMDDPELSGVIEECLEFTRAEDGLVERDAWRPGDADREEARQQNEWFVDQSRGEYVMWEYGGDVVVLGHQNSDLAMWVRWQPDYVSGSFRAAVDESGDIGLYFRGASSVRAAVEAAMAELPTELPVNFE